MPFESACAPPLRPPEGGRKEQGKVRRKAIARTEDPNPAKSSASTGEDSIVNNIDPTPLRPWTIPKGASPVFEAEGLGIVRRSADRYPCESITCSED